MDLPHLLLVSEEEDFKTEGAFMTDSRDGETK